MCTDVRTEMCRVQLHQLQCSLANIFHFLWMHTLGLFAGAAPALSGYCGLKTWIARTIAVSGNSSKEKINYKARLEHKQYLVRLMLYMLDYAAAYEGKS